MADLLKTMPYYGVTAQSEYSTDILFKSAAHLSELYPRLWSHRTLCCGAKEVMSLRLRSLLQTHSRISDQTPSETELAQDV